MVRFDTVLHQASVECAAERGHAIGKYEHVPAVVWLKAWLLSLRLRPGAYPLPGNTRTEVLGQGLRAAGRAAGVTPAE